MTQAGVRDDVEDGIWLGLNRRPELPAFHWCGLDSIHSTTIVCFYRRIANADDHDML